MKKISLKDIKKGMSRDEMKDVKGGKMAPDGCPPMLTCMNGGFKNDMPGGGGNINCCS